jgi:N-glycosylase/DNA lyase
VTATAAPRPLPDDPVTWSDWRPLDGLPPVSAGVLVEIVDGGQAFRWHRGRDLLESPASAAAAPANLVYPQLNDEWIGTWDDHVVRIRRGAEARVEWSAPVAAADRTRAGLEKYFATRSDFVALADQLPWRSDPHLARCLAAFTGLRLLKQPFGETLLGFLCSATKQIVQIKQMVALLARLHGSRVTGAPGDPDPAAADRNPASARPAREAVFHRLPTWIELAQVPEAELRKCLLGFRARYIAETARFLAAHPGWLEETEASPYAAAKERLCSLPGVGEKVADCVLLFGAGRLEAFPVDVWILRTMARRYALDGWRPAQVTQFGRVHFGPLAGLAQQYLFAWERREAKARGRLRDGPAG